MENNAGGGGPPGAGCAAAAAVSTPPQASHGDGVGGLLLRHSSPGVALPRTSLPAHLDLRLGCPGGDSAFQSLFSPSLNQRFQVSQALQVSSGTAEFFKLGQKQDHASHWLLATATLGQLLVLTLVFPAAGEAPRPGCQIRPRAPGSQPPPLRLPVPPAPRHSLSSSPHPVPASPGPRPPGSDTPCPRPNSFLSTLSPFTYRNRQR